MRKRATCFSIHGQRPFPHSECNWARSPCPRRALRDELRRTLAEIEAADEPPGPGLLSERRATNPPALRWQRLCRSFWPDPILPQYQALAPDFFNG